MGTGIGIRKGLFTWTFVIVGISNCRRLARHSIFYGTFYKGFYLMKKINSPTFSACRQPFTVCLLMLALLLPAMLVGCQSFPDTGKEFTSPLADLRQDPFHTARLSCFLTLMDEKGPAIRLEVASIEIFTEDTSLLLTSGPLKIDSTAIGAGQLFLGGAALPPDQYQRLRMLVTKGEVQKSDGRYEVIAPEPFYVEVNLPVGVNLKPEDSLSLLITWDVLNSLQTDNTLDPDLTAILPLKQMLNNLVLVTCPDIDTVFIVRVDKNWVVDSFGLKGNPTHLAIDPDNKNLLYILTSRDRMLKVVELSTFRVVNFFQAPLNDQPTFMTVSPDGRFAFLLDERNGYLSRINLITGEIAARVLLGDQPNYAAYLEEQNLLAVSLALSQKVLLLDPDSLAVRRSISTGNTPQGLIVSNNQLLVAEYGENTISIADLSTMGTQNRLSVGFGPRRLLETGNNEIYVSNYQDGSLSVLEPGQFGVMQVIYGLSRPFEMTVNLLYRRLYVTDEEKAALGVIDTNTNRLLGYIALGARPFDLDMIQ